jgi:glycerol-3-phosphate dehydrogenase (NAD(P)+)
VGPLKYPVVVLGAGAWGTALAIHAARQHPTLLYTRDPLHARALNAARENQKYLPDAPFPAALSVSESLEQAVSAAQDGLLVLGTAMAGLRATVAQLAQCLKMREINTPPQAMVWLCKGIEHSTELRPSQVVAQELAKQGLTSEHVTSGPLSGPSFAQEVAQGLPVSLVLATTDAALRAQCLEALHHHAMRIYTSDDVVGVELAGALKNVVALASGAADGLALGLNARAALITRGLAEMTRLGVALGAQPATFSGLAGVGDLLLTCTGALSRNRKVGLLLAQGLALPQVLRELGHVSEGVACAQAAQRLAAQHQVDMPIVNAVCRVLFEGQAPAAMVKQLLAREPKAERTQ